MAVKFEGDLKTLIHDLEIRGYRVRKAETIKGAPGRTADVFLQNGAIVQWDAYSRTVWTDGPITESQRTETYLRCLYEGGLLGRLWISSLWSLSQSVAFLRAKILQIKRARTQSLAVHAAPPLRAAKAPGSTP